MALNANRHVSGVLRGFDQFMNIVLDNAVDEKNKTDIGMVVRFWAALLRHHAARLHIRQCMLAGHPRQQHCHSGGPGAALNAEAAVHG